MSELKIGLVGLDTSHVPAFTKLLNDNENEYHVAGGKVVAGFPGGSPDFPSSINRVEGYTETIKNDYGVEILDSPEAVAEKCDAIMLTAVDGRAHFSLLQKIIGAGKPVFIDKPFATSSKDANAIAELAKQSGARVMSCSSLRYYEPFIGAMKESDAEIFGADFYGPMAIEATQGGLFWYGIHSVELLYATLGRGCQKVTATATEDNEFVVGVWNDGRIGTVRGNRKGNSKFGGSIHRVGLTQLVDVSNHPKPGYAGLLERVIPFFKGENQDVPLEDTLEIVRFIEAANESRESGKTVVL